MFGHKRRYLFSFLLGSYSFFNIKFTKGDSLLNLPLSDLYLYLIILAMVVCIWEGNNVLQSLLPKKKLQRVSLLLIRQFALSVILVVFISILSTLISNQVLSADYSFVGFNQVAGFTFRINLFLHCINAIITYNNELSQSKLEAETLKNETTEAQYEALRRQINPHFLFNSFNVLSSVIESNPRLAVQFVEQLSVVYRYLLKTQEQKIIPLEEELDFINSYVFLLKIRFGENLQFHKKIVHSDDVSLPPSTLQLLIENAIKHNEVSKSNPLTISLIQENGSLIVSNNKNPKSTIEESSNVGLSNIKNRYELLGNKVPEVKDEEREFVVKISLIPHKEFGNGST